MNPFGPPCPFCQNPTTGRMQAQRRTGEVDYFICAECSRIWTVEPDISVVLSRSRTVVRKVTGWANEV